MRISLLLGLLTLIFTSGYTTERHRDYAALLEQYPTTLGPLGSASLQELEIVTHLEEMEQIEQATGRLVGIVAQDKYWLWLNDPLHFPNGRTGVYGRLIWKSSLTGPAGVAVMALSEEGKIALLCTYRHATRSWELEIPRGARATHETAEEAAHRETEEETGMVLSSLQLLGQIAADSGTTNSVIPIFLARISGKGASNPEDSESITALPFFTPAEIKQGFVQGYLVVDGRQISMRDPFLAYAFLLAEAQGLLHAD